MSPQYFPQTLSRSIPGVCVEGEGEEGTVHQRCGCVNYTDRFMQMSQVISICVNVPVAVL